MTEIILQGMRSFFRWLSNYKDHKWESIEPSDCAEQCLVCGLMITGTSKHLSNIRDSHCYLRGKQDD